MMERFFEIKYAGNHGEGPEFRYVAVQGSCAACLRLRGTEHGLQDLIADHFDSPGRVRQKQRVCLIAFADRLERIEILREQNHGHCVLRRGSLDRL